MYALIMAGGAGTRFWPASRAALPKQLLRLEGEETLLAATLARLDGLVPVEQRLVMTSAALLDAVRRELPEIPAAQILGEPCKRDTAPCIGLAALLLASRDPSATMVVLPSDHVIAPRELFQRSLQQAEALVEAAPQRLVTFGIRPTYPAENFGYIERGEAIKTEAEVAAAREAPSFRVVRFHEKPQAAVAREYLAAGNYYWNAGIFVWKAATILELIKLRQQQMFARLERVAEAYGGPDFERVFADEFTAIGGLSIDYAVMEKAADVAMIEAPFTWDDLGSWQAWARLHGADAAGNTVVARHVGVGTERSIIRGPDNHLIATLGLKDIIVVHTPDATLVANKQDEESIRELTRLLEERGWTEYL